MKKLFSLLSVLTISGTAIPTTIAASPYQKEETIKNSDISYLKTNNLDKLNRNKREYGTGDDLEYSDGKYHIIFKTPTWKEIEKLELSYTNDKYRFTQYFLNRIRDGFWIQHNIDSDYYIKIVGGAIWSSMGFLKEKFKEGGGWSTYGCFKINIKDWSTWGDVETAYITGCN
ncbi:hypothetical protein [Spiroplasma endosymbiont of Phyllotreta cruciferae]|uniref:hypothetical protein n=1 Tax=Spiroplasma endosymbiont of Phyllotreta cruciferae TaxID=2886375 RepID=UPI0020A13FEB|nr:hypothetical protein [Spiroplasma endosymbiont of Phyllotreta cruciferae]